MKIKNKTKAKIIYGWAFALILVGLMLNYLDIGSPDFKIFGGVGNWLIYVGFIGLITVTARVLIKKRQKVVDERMEFIATKALRITFISLLLGSFIIMIIDGINKITLPYHMFMSYMICVLLVVYFISYKILLKLN